VLRRHGVALGEALRVCLDFPLPYVQIRHKDEWDREFLKELETSAALEHRGRLILNDRADYARMFGLGLHVGQEDLPPREARGVVGESAAMGFSTHNAEQLEAAPFEVLDYVALGPIFGTASKENPDPVVGVENLRAWKGLARRPLVAIGGITLASAPAVLAAGADCVGLISALWQSPYTLEGFGNEIETWLKALADSRRDWDYSTRRRS
jgi:thiamine-phosphate pyrophosphorylase